VPGAGGHWRPFAAVLHYCLAGLKPLGYSYEGVETKT
jgi:hypothetical protein